MPTYFARKAGNINATDVWATTPTGTASAVTFASGDVLVANSFAITVNVDTNLGATGQVRNDTTGGATTGGGFTLSNGVTLTANVFGGGAICVNYAGTLGNSANIIGNVTGSTSTAAAAIANTSNGTLIIQGNCTGGTAQGVAVSNTSTGTVNITGNCTGGPSSGGPGNITHGALNSSTGAINITGNCVGGAHPSTIGANNTSTGTLTITGNCTGGSGGHGANNASTGTLTIIGPVSQGGNANLTGGTSTGAFGANNASTGSMFITGPIYASEFDGGVGSANRAGLNFLTGPFYTSPVWGVNPIRCVSWRWATNLVNTTFIEVPTSNLAAKRNLVTPDNATNFPVPANVRSGTAYGIGGELTGTCVVPSPASVAAGVNVDNTVGTLTTPTASQVATAVRTELATELGRIDAAISSRLAPSGTLARVTLVDTATTLTNAPSSAPTAAQNAAAVWSAATRTITGGTVDTLTNAPTVPSASAIAGQVRTELTPELTKVAALNPERLGQCVTTNILGTLLTQANS